MQKYFTKFLKYGTLLSTYGLIGSVLLQIFARFFLTNTPAWTEEASRLFFIYAMAFAAGLALKSDEYVALDIFFEKLNPILQKRLLLVVQGLIVLLFGITAVYSIKFVQLGMPESSPSMAISMSVAFFSMFLMSASICYFACLEIQKIRKKIDR
ncbi:MAG: TRAP transporter small permease [Bacteroidota bacterium]